MNVDLSCRQADAIGGVHRLQHVVDQITQWGVHSVDWYRPGTQSGVWILQDCEARHVRGAVGACN